jgi:hypothetical protein
MEANRGVIVRGLPNGVDVLDGTLAPLGQSPLRVGEFLTQ